jgi:DNA-binding CsgD family transcriptional regulator
MAMRADTEHPWYERIIEEIRRAPVPTSVVSRRELDTLRASSHGLVGQEVAALLGIGEESVKSYLTSARRKLRAKNTTHAVALAIRAGIL